MAAAIPEDVEHVQLTRYTAEDVDRALLAYAAAGSSISAASATGIPPRTIQYWRHRYPRRFAQLARRHSAEIEQCIVVSLRETVAAANAGAIEAVHLERQRLAAGQVKDAAASARNLATVVGISTTKVLELEGRPTAVIEHRADPLKRLQAKGYINSTADELPATDTPPAAFLREAAAANARALEPGEPDPGPAST